MNTLNKFLAAAATATVLLSGNAAFAADTAPTRAQVVAELAQARADGSIAAFNSDDSEHFLQKASTAKASAVQAATLPKTRAQVIAELRASQQDGTLALMHSEFPSDQARLAQIQAQKAAATAMAE
ncbi:DUF4148 domain-containing protein [Paucibacter sp. R3-3]|uniref:DUF4148 domain-containing protein n=1 Tax=Roseateles agri TaxID=3098619 RepID=A0ABU5DGF0_9BURK|nr:DUF4148 domain-containing protein [Paucibacter sp. R3-3]MDY0744871.1 DUF4148 domain-containing protein [Paucibacter sp. R3-3]